MEPKPGYKTTEFYMVLAAALVGLAFSSGILTPAEGEAPSLWLQVAGFVQSALVTMGYAISRGLTKAGATPPAA